LIFELVISGAPETVRVSSFAGCFDTQLGLEYEDCYFSIPILSQPVIDWINDTVQGVNLRHDLSVFAFQAAGNTPTSHIEIGNAFLSDFRVADFDSASNAPGSLSFVAVPDSLQTQTGGTVAPPPASSQKLLRRGYFQVTVGTTQLSAIAGVSGIHFSVPKVPAPATAAGRHQFVPGAPSYDDLQLDVPGGGMGGSLTATVQHLDAWVTAAAAAPDPRDVDISFLNPALAVLGTLHLTNVTPLSALEPFPSGNRRSITLDYQQFGFLPLP
jgi:hypothetical protein